MIGSRFFLIRNSLNITALQDTFYYDYKINGNGRQGYSKKFVMDGAWFKYVNYRAHETLKTSGPLHRDINLLVCF